MDDLYGVLQTSPSAESSAIQAAYRKLAFQYHPDRNPERRDWAEEQMKRLNAAYYVLSNPSRRHTYDSKRFTTGRSGIYYPPPAPRPTASASASRPPGSTGAGQTATKRRSGAAYPLETENDWFNLHIYASGRTLPDEEEAAEERMDEYLREFVRRITPPGSGKSALTDLLLSAATSQYVVYSPYARLAAKITLRTVLATLRGQKAENSFSGPILRDLIARVNDGVQDRMGTESLRMTENGKNVVADWSGMLYTVVDFIWGEET